MYSLRDAGVSEPVVLCEKPRSVRKDREYLRYCPVIGGGELSVEG